MLSKYVTIAYNLVEGWHSQSWEEIHHLSEYVEEAFEPRDGPVAVKVALSGKSGDEVLTAYHWKGMHTQWNAERFQD